MTTQRIAENMDRYMEDLGSRILRRNRHSKPPHLYTQTLIAIRLFEGKRIGYYQKAKDKRNYSDASYLLTRTLWITFLENWKVMMVRTDINW